MADRLLLICLAVFFLLWGFAHATNIQIVWMTPATAVAALIAGIIYTVRAAQG